MNFQNVISTVIGELEKVGVGYALIGGFALAMRGVQRATMDLDFILALEDLDQADEILRSHGYQRAYRSPNVSHYISAQRDWGRIDLLHAFREPSLKMLERAESMEVSPGLRLRVAQIEDLIALKLQALKNDPRRITGDWADIRLIIEAAALRRQPLDWERLADYLEIFHLSDQMEQLKSWYGPIE